MIDVHCHILPGLDDGASDLDDAVGMARQADADGIEIVCATPHIRHDHDIAIGEIGSRVAELDAELERRGLDVRVRTGGEVAETALASLDDGELHALTLGGGGRWILLEPAPGPLGESYYKAVVDLERRGFGAVVAHPERHANGSLMERLEELVERGALVQLTAALLTDPGAGPVMAGLARRGLVHLLGSDAHSSRSGRPVALSDGVAALRAAGGLYAEELDTIVRDVPADVLQGKRIDPPFARRRR